MAAPDVNALRANLREEDLAECLGFGVSIQKALWISYKGSLVRKTAYVDGELAACWGVGGVFLGRVGNPWLLTTPAAKNISPLRFARIYQMEVMAMLKMFSRLENFVDARYDAAIRLLEIIGFTVEEPEKLGNGVYRRFWIEA